MDDLNLVSTVGDALASKARGAAQSGSVAPPCTIGGKLRRKCVLTLFGTRPEVIKLAPVIHELELRPESLRTINVASGQHTDLIHPFIDMFSIRVDYNLRPITVNQTPIELCTQISSELEAVIDREVPEMILVQGDTTSALAGALTGRRRRIAVGHVEAGLRSGNLLSPYPEEMNRRLITRLATYHFAATKTNRDLLLSEGVPQERVFLTGNPIVDALQMVLRARNPLTKQSFVGHAANKCIVLTTHRRESFGQVLADNLRVLCQFVREHDDVMMVFPVHPNPNVRRSAEAICKDNPRVILSEPLGYGDFINLLSSSWLIVSDSGGIQEEVPSLGKPLLILRENTEREECIKAGMARLVGGRPEKLMVMLEEAYREGSWVNSVDRVPNPFGSGNSGARIVGCLVNLLSNANDPMKEIHVGN